MSDSDTSVFTCSEGAPAPERVILTDLIAELREVHVAGGQDCDMCRDGWPCWDETAVQRAEARLQALDQAEPKEKLTTTSAFGDDLARDIEADPEFRRGFVGGSMHIAAVDEVVYALDDSREEVNGNECEETSESKDR